MLWFGKSLCYAALQISNFFFQRSVDYFNANSGFEPLVHTWSLAVEEQFYLLMPVILFITIKFSKSKNLPFLAIFFLTLLSLGISQYLVFANQKVAFYSLPSRFWELGIGCLLAFVKHNDFSLRAKNFISSLGVTLIFLSQILIKESAFPGFSALIPCFGTVLIIFSGPKKKLVKKLFVPNFLPIKFLFSSEKFLIRFTFGTCRCLFYTKDIAIIASSLCSNHYCYSQFYSPFPTFLGASLKCHSENGASITRFTSGHFV